MSNLTYNFTLREKNGGWQIILSYKDTCGRWKTKSKQGFSKKKDAKAYGDKLLEIVKKQLHNETVSNATAFELQGISLLEFHEMVCKNDNLAFNSVLAYEGALKRFGHDFITKPIASITYLDIVAAMQDWAYSQPSQRQSLIWIKKLFKQAIKPYRIRTDNPAEDIPLPAETKKRKNKIKALTQSELNTLLSSLKETDFKAYTICAIAGLAGLRYGEIMGLMYTDLNAKDATLSITKQINRIGRNPVTGKLIYGLKDIKNGDAGYRTIPIPRKLVRIIQAYIHFMPVNMNGLIFTNGTSSSTAVNKKIQKFLPNSSVHDLRHTYATLLLANGTDIKTVAALIGDNIDTVMMTYIDYTDDMRINAAKSIQKIFA